MLKRFQSFFMKNDVHNRQSSLYPASGARNPSIESWNVYTKAQLYSQESKQDPERQSLARLPVSNEVRDRKIDQHVQAGIEFHELGQLEKATHHFRLAAKEGCPIGMFLYGISLRHGWGCRLNTALAFQYLQTAAEHAVDDLLQGDDCALASKGELIIAIYELGVSFQQGWGVPKNKETAFYYFEIAASLGDADAMNDIAFCYTHGHGVKKDIYKAAYYYRMASRQGQGQVGNSWIWKDKYNIVDEPNWDGKSHAISKSRLDMSLFIESRKDKVPIEIRLDYKGSKEINNIPAIVIGHPYGPLGGNMHNNVVIALQRYFVSKGYLTVCINFRGCGNSKGRTSWTGMPEREDYYGVIDFITKDNNEHLKNYPKVSSVLLCGYSFGGMIASSIESTPDMDYAYLLISLPLGVYWALATTKASFFKKQPSSSDAPVFCIYGDNDQFTGVDTYEKWLKEKQSVKAIKVEGADHFWMDFEQSLVEHVDRWRGQYWK